MSLRMDISWALLRRPDRMLVGQVRSLIWIMVASISFSSVPAHAIPQMDLNRGDPIPARALTTIDGKRINTTGSDAKVRILLFGQTGHEPSARACKHIEDALKDPLLINVPIEWVVILSKSSIPAQSALCSADGEHRPLIVHDTDRAVFGTFHIIVVPSVVIVDDHDRVVYAISGMTPRFGDLVNDAILLAADKITESAFESALHPEPGPKNNERIRAERIIKLARRAASRGMDELAYSQYVHAIEVDPSFASARLGLGRLLQRQMKLTQAQDVFEALIALEPSSPEPRLGLAGVLILRGDDGIERAEQLINEVLGQDPENPLAHYTLGLLFEAQSQPVRAAQSFKKAARLQLNSADPDLQLDD